MAGPKPLGRYGSSMSAPDPNDEYLPYRVDGYGYRVRPEREQP